MTRAMPVWLIPAVVALALPVAFWHRDRFVARYGLPCMIVFAVCHALAYDALRDDAFISFRYAQNWAEGHGVVFNPGERVEGYSNFLLVAMLAALHGWFGLDIVSAAVFIGVVSTVGTVWAVERYASLRARGDRRAGLLAAMVVGGSASFAAYAFCGLETSLFACLVVMALLVGARGGTLTAGVLAGLATMARPEGGWVFVALFAGCGFGGERRVGRSLRTTVGYLALVAPWMIWRVSYYGYLVPNQIAAKRGMDPAYQLELGLRYLVKGAAAQIGYALLGLVAVWLVLRGWRIARRRIDHVDLVLVVAFAGFAAFPVATGGDWMPAYRFTITAVVVGAMVCARGWTVAREASVSPMVARQFAVAVLVVIVQGMTMPKMYEYVVAQNHVVEGEIEVGKWLGRSLPEDTVTAAWANGAVPFYSRLHTIDLLGLTDEHIARRGKRLPKGHPGHIAFDSEYVVKRAPDVITYLGGGGLKPEPKDDLASGNFAVYEKSYVTVCFEFSQMENPEGTFASLWVRRDRAEELTAMLTDEARGIRVVPTTR